MVQDVIFWFISTENCTKQHSFSELTSKNSLGFENIKNLEINASTFLKVNACSKIQNLTCTSGCVNVGIKVPNFYHMKRQHGQHGFTETEIFVLTQVDSAFS